ncbi:MAG TPA: PTS sugar transporter subunit IIA [Caldimonas sp.]|nr:PTS sugar transporter subunit IIA [Caldimonas sp.]
MNQLAETLSTGDVLVDVVATSKQDLFEQAGALFERNHSIAKKIVVENLLARERLGSTGLGHGVAIPHGRIKGLEHPVAAVFRLREPIAFDAPDEERVAILVFLFVPEMATQRHLEILSGIAEMLADGDLRERAKKEGDSAALHRMLTSWQPDAPQVARGALAGRS